MKTNGLWEPAKATLDATISSQTSIQGSQFCVIPFGDNPHQPFEFDSSNYNGTKSAINKAFDNYINQEEFTRISNVLKAGFKIVDANKDNKIYLLTDGMPNGGDSPKLVANTIREWCGNHHNCRLFYVALTKGVINPEIKQAIDDCPDAYIVQCENKVIPQIADLSPSEVYTNLAELSTPREISFSIPGKYALAVEANDSLFDVSVAENAAIDGKIKVYLIAKNGDDQAQLYQKLQGREYSFPVKIQCKEKGYFIANPEVIIHVSDETPSKLAIARGEDELRAGGAEWYDSFLWSDAAPEEKIRWDLSPIFTHQFYNSKLTLKFQADNGNEADFQAWFNGNPINNGSIIQILPDYPAILEVQFNHDAYSGKRYFSLKPAKTEGLDLINERPHDEYEGTSLRTEYDVVWNPLKTALAWLAGILLILLILWLAFLKRLFFPTIRIAKVTMTGPGSYYLSKKIKGARKVIFTSKRKSQNILSRIFTGEVRFVRADHFSPDLTIEGAGGKKKVKLQSVGKAGNAWDIYPSSIFRQYEKGTITNRLTKESAEIEFN